MMTSPTVPTQSDDASETDDAATTLVAPEPTTTPIEQHVDPQAQPGYQPPPGYELREVQHPLSSRVKNAIIAGGVGLAVVFGLLGFGAGYIVGDHSSSNTPSQMMPGGINGPGGMSGGGMGGFGGTGSGSTGGPGMNGGMGRSGGMGGPGMNGGSGFGAPGTNSGTGTATN